MTWFSPLTKADLV